MAAVIGRHRGKHLFVMKMSLRRNIVVIFARNTQSPAEAGIPAGVANAVPTRAGWHRCGAGRHMAAFRVC